MQFVMMKNICPINGFLIFITVLKEMVFQSFEVQAYDYMVKPVEEKQFAVGAVIINDFVPASTIIGFVVLIFLLTAYGTVICHADFKHSLLYAALAAAYGSDFHSNPDDIYYE